MSLRKLALAVTARVCMIAFISLLIFSVTVPNTAYCQPPPPSTRPYVYVLVNSTIYGSLSSALQTYKQDLENDGFSVEIPTDFGENATAIREFLQNEAEKHQIAGVLLVGNVPYATYKHFPCDLYYMDLDGNWKDFDGDGIYDMHTNETGDLQPEIWVGRLYASTLTGLFSPRSEVDLINNYFEKNHLYRTGKRTLAKRALGYIDDFESDPPGQFACCVEEVNSSLSMIYGNETTVVAGEGEATNATNYINRLNDTLGYQWVHLVAHGNLLKHLFDYEKNPPPVTEVSSADIQDVDPHVFFYNLESCFVGNYNFTGYIAGSYVFADTYGLLAIASTTFGGMGAWISGISGRHLRNFYGPIAYGKCIGKAFKEWAQKAWESGSKFNYGLTLLGDPTLTPLIYNLTVLAKDQYDNDLTTGYVYIDGLYRGCTGSSFMLSKGTHTVWTSDFWEAGQTGCRYVFQHWEEDNSTDNPRNITVFEDTTIKAIFNKMWCEPVPLPNWSFEELEEGALAPCVIQDWLTNHRGWREPCSDVNQDGKVSAVDIAKLNLIINGYIKRPYWPLVPDVNCDGKVSAADILKVILDMGGQRVCPRPIDGKYSWYTSEAGDYQMWQWLNDSDTIQAMAGQTIVFSFWFYPESVASDGSQNNARAEIYYEYDGGNNTRYGVWIGPRERGWWNVYVTVSLPSNITAFKVTIHGTPDFKAWVDLAQLYSIE